jgi:hypothetical protein
VEPTLKVYRMLKRPFSKAAASEEARRTLRYVEPLSDARTMLAVFFSILRGMGADKPESRKDTTQAGPLPALLLSP